MDEQQHRADCEARYRLKETGGRPADVAAMLKRVAEKRGQEAADRLKADMRRLYREGRQHDNEPAPPR